MAHGNVADPQAAGDPMPVVWAEDEPSDQFMIRSALEEFPAAPRIRWANDGEAAVAAAQAQRPRLIVLDINMPRVDGIEALRRIRADPALDDVPVVMFSTARRSNEVEECEGLGVAAFVQKPTQFQEFANAVHHIVGLAHGHRRPTLSAQASAAVGSDE